MTTLSPNLEAILDDLRPAAMRIAAGHGRRHPWSRTAMPLVIGSAVCAGAAVAAVSLVGAPAPERVKEDLRAVDAGMPADLRQNPDVEHARAVAVSDRTVVYLAELAGGGHCSEMVVDGRAAGATCATAEEAASIPIGVTVPYVDPVTSTSPVAVSGYVSVAGATAVELVYPDGASDTVALTKERFYVADVPRDHLAAVHRGGLRILAKDADGSTLAQTAVPDDAITPPSEAARRHDPIEIDTVSDGSDFTRVLAVRGQVRIAAAATMRLRYPDGTSVAMALAHGRFHLDIPAARQDDFARAAGAVLAYDTAGRLVGRRAVASVAAYRARQVGTGQ